MAPAAEMRSAEADLIARLRGGDEAAFSCLVHTYSASLKRVAIAFVPSDAVADEVVQDTWLAVLNGIDRFEGRSSVKTWIFRILTKPRQDARNSRKANDQLLRAGRSPGDRPARRRPCAIPARLALHLARSLGKSPRALVGVSRRRCRRPRDDGGPAAWAGKLAAGAARGGGASRRARVAGVRSLRGARFERG